MTKHLQVTHSGQVMLKYPLKHSVVVSIRSMLCQMLNVLTLRKIMKMQMPSMRENGIYSHTCMVARMIGLQAALTEEH